MRRIIYLLSAIIIISNGVWGWIYLKNVDRPPLNSEVRIYSFNGEGEKWDITGYKVIVTPNKILRGYGSLAFKGDSDDIRNSSHYKFEVKEQNINGNYETVYVSEAYSKDGPVSILENLDDIGSMTSEYFTDEINKDIQNFESTTITITWNDNEGEAYSEMISLSINSENIIDYTKG